MVFGYKKFFLYCSVSMVICNVFCLFRVRKSNFTAVKFPIRCNTAFDRRKKLTKAKDKSGITCTSLSNFPLQLSNNIRRKWFQPNVYVWQRKCTRFNCQINHIIQTNQKISSIFDAHNEIRGRNVATDSVQLEKIS